MKTDMPYMKGVRVVRGPNWIWGDQDGGEGGTGTVTGLTDYELQQPEPKMVNVLWDSGFKGCYRCGPEGSHDLRIVNYASCGEIHKNVKCDGAGCKVQEIRGSRWQCVTCYVNLCTNCYLRETPHSKSHHLFQRYDKRWTEKPTIVSDETDGKKIQLKGIYPGAHVFLGPPNEFYCKKQNERKIGLVIPNPHQGTYDEVILVAWLPAKDRIITRHGRLYDEETTMLSLKEIGIGGCYNPDGFPVLDIPFKNGNGFLRRFAPFSVGDQVLVHQDDIQLYGNFKGFIGVVEKVELSHVYVHFNRLNFDRTKRLNPDAIKKLNKFSVNESVRILNDQFTITEMEREFGILQHEDREKVDKMRTGRVSGIDAENPAEKVYVNFDDPTMHKWLLKEKSLPSTWIEHHNPPEPSLDEELIDFVTKGTRLFLRAVEEENLLIVKILFNHHKIHVNARNADGTTDLLVACQKGNKDLVKWLLDQAEADMEEQDYRGFRAIHHVAKKGDLKLLKILMKRGVHLDGQTKSGKTAIHLAVANLYTDCVCLLIQGGCDLNIQCCNGETPLHSAISSGIAPQRLIRILTTSGRIDWSLRDKNGFDVLQMAIIMENLDTIGHILECEDRDLSLLPMPTTNKSIRNTTVLHYACIQRNVQIVQLLLNRQFMNVIKIDGVTLIPSQLEELLEAKNELGMTALLLSCQTKDCALIELLVKAGANLKAVDANGRTAIILAASSPEEDQIPTEEASPNIFKVYQTIQRQIAGNDAILLSLIVYLVDKGCCLKSATSSGLKASDILLSNGFLPVDIRKIQARSNAMKQSKETINSIVLNQPKLLSSSMEESKLNITDEEKDLDAFNSSGLSWINDATENGFIRDQLGYKFEWDGCQKDGVMDYRCTKHCAGFKQSRCTAVAQKILNLTDGTSRIRLESLHSHPTGKKTDGASSSSGPPPGKKARRVW